MVKGPVKEKSTFIPSLKVMSWVIVTPTIVFDPVYSPLRSAKTKVRNANKRSILQIAEVDENC